MKKASLYSLESKKRRRTIYGGSSTLRHPKIMRSGKSEPKRHDTCDQSLPQGPEKFPNIQPARAIGSHHAVSIRRTRCRQKRRYNVLDKQEGKVKRRARRPANSSGKRCIT